MKNFKIVLSSLIFSLGVHAIANETTNISPSTTTLENPSDLLTTPAQSPLTKKTIYYGSLSIAPGAGVSLRERKGLKGSSIDCKAGILILPILWGGEMTPNVSVDYNFLQYARKQEISSYTSYGIGAACDISTAPFLPYIPLHTGIEFKHGFFDIGVKIFYIPSTLIPSPEIRTGISF